MISSSWWTTLRPGNSGLPNRISAKMQPMLQMSIAGEYLAKKEPHSSGARYHLHSQVFQNLAGCLHYSFPAQLDASHLAYQAMMEARLRQEYSSTDVCLFLLIYKHEMIQARLRQGICACK